MTASAQAPDADPAAAFGIVVDAIAPVLALGERDPQVCCGGGTGTRRSRCGDRRRRREHPSPRCACPSTCGPYLAPPRAAGRLHRVAEPTHGHLRPGDGGGGLDRAGPGRRPGGRERAGHRVGRGHGRRCRDGAEPEPVQTSSAGLDVRGSFAHADVTEIGAPLLSCSPTVAGVRLGDREGRPGQQLAHHGAARRGAAGPEGTPRSKVPVSSTARLDVPEGREIVFAGLYWSANVGPRDTWSGSRELARLRGPGGTYTDVTGKVIAEPTDNACRQYYQSFADVTDLVAARRRGRLVGRRRRRQRDGHRPGPDLLRRLVARRRVLRPRRRTPRSPSTTAASGSVPPRCRPPSSSPPRRARAARIGVVAWEGDRTGTGDRLVLGDTCGSGGTTQRPLRPTRWDGSNGSAQRLRLHRDGLAGDQLAGHRRQGVPPR